MLNVFYSLFYTKERENVSIFILTSYQRFTASTFINLNDLITKYVDLYIFFLLTFYQNKDKKIKLVISLER
jgi:hypothetical protein